MNNDTKKQGFLFGFLAYLLYVFILSFLGSFLFNLHELDIQKNAPNFVFTGNFSDPISYGTIRFLLVFVVLLFMLWIPFTVIYLIVSLGKIRNLAFFILSGMLLGVCATFVISLIPNFGFSVEGSVEAYIEQRFKDWFSCFLTAGAAGGLTLRIINRALQSRNSDRKINLVI